MAIFVSSILTGQKKKVISSCFFVHLLRKFLERTEQYRDRQAWGWGGLLLLSTEHKKSKQKQKIFCDYFIAQRIEKINDKTVCNTNNRAPGGSGGWGGGVVSFGGVWVVVLGGNQPLPLRSENHHSSASLILQPSFLLLILYQPLWREISFFSLLTLCLYIDPCSKELTILTHRGSFSKEIPLYQRKNKNIFLPILISFFQIKTFK